MNSAETMPAESQSGLGAAPALPERALAIRSLWDQAALEAAVQAESQATDDESLWMSALAHHNLAALGRRGSAAAAEAQLKHLLERQPDQPLALAYMGNAIIMVARDSRNVMTKASTVKKGIGFLDRAVALAPDDISIRLLRAGSGKRLPKLFGRRAITIADLAHAAVLLEREANGDPETLSEVYYDLAVLTVDKDDKPQRQQYFVRARDAAPRSSWATKARENLSKEFAI